MTVETPKLSEDFSDFLIKAKQHGYGSGDVQKVEMDNGSTTIVYYGDGIRYMDSYAGGIPYSGYEHVSARVEDGTRRYVPIWAMSYRGKTLNSDIEDESLGSLLGEFLVTPEAALPIRGPFNALDATKKYRYRLTHAATTTSLNEFDAGEAVYLHEDNRMIYTARFIGGVVNNNLGIHKLAPRWFVDGEA